MKITIVYREESDHAREVFDFLHDFEKRTGQTIEEINPDSPRNEFFIRAYDIVEYPTIVALSADSRLQAMWRGLPLPLISEVSYYAVQN